MLESGLTTESNLTMKPVDVTIGDWQATTKDNLPSAGEMVLGCFVYECKKTNTKNQWIASCFLDQGEWVEVRALAPAGVFTNAEQAGEDFDPDAMSCLSTPCRFGDPVAWATLGKASTDETLQKELGTEE